MNWDRLAPLYDLFENVYNGKCNRGIVETITNYVSENDEVLECACGTGLLTVPMAGKVRRLIATDYSDGMLKQLIKKVARFSNVKVSQASILELPFEDDKFDKVVAANVIHLLDDPDKALAEMVRVCKNGGQLIIPTYINASRKTAKAGEKFVSMLGVKFQNEFDIDTYKEFFAKRGFEAQYKVIDGRMPCAFAVIENHK